LFWFTTKSLNLLGEKAGLKFFEIEVRKDTYIFNSITNAPPTLTNKHEPIMKNKKTNKIKSQIFSYSPTFIKRLYYKLIKRSNTKISKEHHTIFFVYKNMQNTAR
jgi:hypothetical protein